MTKFPKKFGNYLKVSKSQKYFFLKLHCPKNERNIWQNSAGHWSFNKKCFWDLLAPYIESVKWEIWSVLLKSTKFSPFFRSCCNGNSNHFTVSTIDWKNQGSVIPQSNAAIKRRKEEKSTRSTQLGNRRILNSLIHQISNFFNILIFCQFVDE